ncbi:hypothetical protein [Singulisphaera sp. PoT]|uniref:hypothetical protein n=1 Tax=Singulisphaera sp. PoT TaxID=3411797 RepID=UPI003BF4C747
MIVIACGCEQIPTPRANTAPIHIPQAQAEPLPPLKPVEEVQPQAQGTIPAPAPEASVKPGPLVVPTRLATHSEIPTDKSSVAQATPLLDEALAQAEDLQRITSEDGKDSPKVDPELKAAAHVSTDSIATPPGTPAHGDKVEQTSQTKEPITLAAAPAIISPPIRADKPAIPPKTPQERWRDGLQQLRDLAKEQEHNADSSVSLWSLREQMLDLVGQSEDRASLRRSILKSFLGLESDWQPGEEQERANEVREAITALEEQAPLQITDLKLCLKVNGFGNFETLDPTDCKPGQTMIVYCEMSGVRYAETGETFHSKITSQIQLVSSKGGEPVWKQALGTAEDYCRSRRRDVFVVCRLTLPENLEPGSYELHLNQEDELAGRNTSSKINLTIHQ